MGQATLVWVTGLGMVVIAVSNQPRGVRWMGQWFREWEQGAKQDATTGFIHVFHTILLVQPIDMCVLYTRQPFGTTWDQQTTQTKEPTTRSTGSLPTETRRGIESYFWKSSS